MSDDADIVPMPGQEPHSGGPADGGKDEPEVVRPDAVLSDRPRTWQDIVKEAMLLTPNLVKLLSRLLKDRRVPIRRKVVAGAVLAYLVSPIDLIPDVIPVAGRVDDVLLVAFAIDYLMKGTGRSIVLELWDGSDDAFELLAVIAEWGTDLIPLPVRRLLSR